MEFFGIAGGAPPGGEDWGLCCGYFLILPLVALLAGLAVYRTSLGTAVMALLLAGLPYLLLRQVVAGYQPSDDGDVVADQETGRQAVAFYAWLVAVAGLSVVWVAGRQLVRWGSKRA